MSCSAELSMNKFYNLTRRQQLKETHNVESNDLENIPCKVYLSVSNWQHVTFRFDLLPIANLLPE